MELRHLRYFLAVADELNFRRAAERLHLAQPSLSAQIRQLEDELGFALLHRTTRRVALTAAGEAFRDGARGVLAALADTLDQARRADRGQVGRLRVGFTGSATYELLPPVATAFRERYPDVALDLHGEMFTPAQVRALLIGELDVAFLRPPVDADGLAVEVLRCEQLIAILPAGHPLAIRPELRLAELAGETFVGYPSPWRSVVSAAVLDACRGAGFTPRVALEASETASLVSFVAAGLGVALVPASVRHLHVAGAVTRPLAPPAPSVQLALAWRADDPSPVLARFLEVARTSAGDRETDR